MKPTKIILPIIGLTMLCGCGKDDGPHPDDRKTYLTKLTNNGGSSVFAYNDDDQLVSITFTANDGTVSTATYSDFNAAGLPTKQTANENGEISSKEMEYDSQNRLRKITVRDAANALYKTTEYTYGTHTMEFSNYSSSGGLWGRYVYTFDAAGNVLGYDVYDSSDMVTDRITCKSYDSKKSLKEFYYHEDNRPFTSFSTNNILEYQSVLGGTDTYTFTYTHEYNADGYPTKRSLLISPTGYTSTETYEYVKR